MQHCGFFLSNPAISRAGSPCCCCVIHACCHRYNAAAVAAAAAAAAVRFSCPAACGREFRPLLRRLRSYFCKSCPTSVLLRSVRHACVDVCHAWSLLYIFRIASSLSFPESWERERCLPSARDLYRSFLQYPGYLDHPNFTSLSLL